MNVLVLNRGICSFCNGHCCRDYVITVTSIDVAIISLKTGLDPREFAELRKMDLLTFSPNEVIECYKRGQFEGVYVLTIKSHPCYFFDEKTNTCKIYKFAPTSCRIYPYNEHGRVSERAVCPLLPRLLFSMKKPKLSLIKRMKRETSAYHRMVDVCNRAMLDKERCFNKLIEMGMYYVKNRRLPF